MPWKGAAQFRLARAAAKTSDAANRKWLDKATIPSSPKPIPDRRGKSGDPSLAQDAAALAHEALNNLSVDLLGPSNAGAWHWDPLPFDLAWHLDCWCAGKVSPQFDLGERLESDGGISPKPPHS